MINFNVRNYEHCAIKQNQAARIRRFYFTSGGRPDSKSKILFYEQALVRPSNKKKSTRADVDDFIAKWRITVFFSKLFWPIIYLAI